MREGLRSWARPCSLLGTWLEGKPDNMKEEERPPPTWKLGCSLSSEGRTRDSGGPLLSLGLLLLERKEGGCRRVKLGSEGWESLSSS